MIDAQGEALGSTVLPLLDAHGQRLDGLDEAVTYLRADLIEHVSGAAQFGARINAVDDAARGFRSLTVTQRFRWLLTGRW